MTAPLITVNGPTGNDIVDTGRGKNETDKGIQNKVTPDAIVAAFSAGRTVKAGATTDEATINEGRGADAGLFVDTPSEYTQRLYNADNYITQPSVPTDPHTITAAAPAATPSA